MTPRTMILIAITVTILMVALMFFSSIGKGKQSKGSTGNDITEIASVQFHSSGCFHLTNETINLYNENSDYIVHFVEPKRTRKFKVSPSQKDSIIAFIDKVEAFKPPPGRDCTTISVYQVKMNGKEFKKADGGCSLHGYYEMKETLHLNPQIF